MHFATVHLKLGANCFHRRTYISRQTNNRALTHTVNKLSIIIISPLDVSAHTYIYTHRNIYANKKVINIPI